MNTDICILDIETGPVEHIDSIMPEFSAPSNYKDPEKIAAYIESEKAKYREKAALSALSGRILAVGLKFVGKQTVVVGDADEADILRHVTATIREARMGASYKIVGFALHSFDIPFIVRRCLINGVSVPSGLLPNGSSRFYMPPWLVDLRQIWGVGEYQPSGSLGEICKAFGLGEKNGHGKDFAGLWINGETKPEAIDYLMRDMELTERLAGRMLGFDVARHETLEIAA